MAWTAPFYVTDGPACEEIYLGGGVRDLQKRHPTVLGTST